MSDALRCHILVLLKLLAYLFICLMFCQFLSVTLELVENILDICGYEKGFMITSAVRYQIQEATLYHGGE